jgi:hypothetical protein
MLSLVWEGAVCRMVIINISQNEVEDVMENINTSPWLAARGSVGCSLRGESSSEVTQGICQSRLALAGNRHHHRVTQLKLRRPDGKIICRDTKLPY